MAFTATDLTNVEAAIVVLATGSRSVQVVMAGKSITYTDSTVSLERLSILRSTIQAELGLISFRVYAKQGGRGA